MPAYFNNFLHNFSSNHNHNTRYRGDFRLRTTNRFATEEILRYRLREVLNNLPETIKASVHTHSLQAVKYKFKVHALGTYQASCSIHNCYVCDRTAN